MKHNPSKLLSLLFAVPFVCMCSKENSNEPASKGEQITITATMSDTKVDLTQGQGELLLTWSEGDALMVIGNTAEKYDIVDDGSGIGTRTATFLGTSVEGEKFTVYYPGTYATVEDLTARSYEGQVQTGNGNLGHLEYNSLAQGLSDFREVNFGADGVWNNGVLKLVVTLPEAVTEVSSISISAPEEIFYTTNGTEEKTATLTLGFENCVIDDDHILTAYMMTSWQDVTIKSGTKLRIDVTVPERLCRYTKTFSNSADINLNGGACLNIDISNAATLDHVLSGSGTQADPYLLYDAEDMMAVREYLTKGTDTEAKCFKMVNDIDMNMASFTALTSDAACAYKIDFTSDITDGSRKTLRNLKIENQTYASIFGILNGNVHDVDFENIQVKQNNGTATGVICGFLGSIGGYVGKIKNVDIRKSSVKYDNNSVHSCGVVCGYFGRGEIDNVIVDNDCYASLKITNSPKENFIGLGGIAGRMRVPEEFTIKNCTCNATLEWLTSNLTTDHGYEGMGGIIGVVDGQETKFTIKKCTFAGQMMIDSGINLYHIGGIVGLDATGGLKIIDCTNNANIELNQHYVGGIIGRSKANEQTVTNCEISGCYNYGKINSSAKNFIAGIAGELSNNGRITNCHNHNEITGTQRVVGIVGKTGTNAVISGCSNNGKITANGQYSGGIVGEFLGSEIEKCDNYEDVNAAGRAGGIAGYVENGTVSGCSNTADLSSSATYTAGIVGQQKAGTITGCHNTGGISSSVNYLGGIVGHMLGNVEKCYNMGPITGTAKYNGGIIGFLETGNVDQCFNKGRIQGSECTGGIVGIMSTQTSTTEYVVSNCYNSSDIYSSAQYAGGIIGDARQYTTFKALYSRGTVQGTNVSKNYGRALGGIIGRMANSSSTAKDANYNNKLYYCISYVDKISAAGTTSNYSSGAIVGFTGTKLATSHCYRSASLILECTAKPDGVDMLVNQGHSITEITTGISPGYWYPYHGNAVSGAQFAVGVTPVAQYINTEITGAWDTDIWDFTGNNPTLKNNPEPAAE